MVPPNRVVAAVDDDRRVRESIQSILESAGYEPVAFESGEAFLASGTLSQVVCVVADVRLPGIDGLELQRRVRRDRPRVPMIFITAHDDDDTRRQALRDGAAAFMIKPFDGEELLDRIARTTNEN